MKRSEKFTNKEFAAFFDDLDLMKSTGKVCNHLIKTKKYSKEEIIPYLNQIVEKPEDFLDHIDFGELAKILQDAAPAIKIRKEYAIASENIFSLQPEPVPYSIFGARHIEQVALDQMDIAMRLPVSLAGALMPDAHSGYGLPIGGVLATTNNSIIPYAVGVDIACRMCLSVFDIEAKYLDQKHNLLKNVLLESTCFGTGGQFKKPMEDDLFDQPEWNATKIIRDLKHKAKLQVGTSGTGNHFVEWGILEIFEGQKDLKLPKGKYLALLSHSGSRGFGANIAGHYSKIAREKTKLPKEAQHLAWLDMDTQEGQEYWIGMNLAGEYASANHHHIHKKAAKSLGVKPVVMIENHHNFAWKEQLEDGTEVMVHRKGATPAQVGELGIIPGSMTQPGFVVKGKGNLESINSASHGAGRQMSRTQALKSIKLSDLQRALTDEGVFLIGADLDEAPMAYKNIEEVMKMQQELVETLAKFSPKIVRMAESEKRSKKFKAEAWKKGKYLTDGE